MIFGRRATAPAPPFTEGATYIVPVLLSMADVRMLPFAPYAMSTDTHVEGIVTMPDGTSATGVVPLNTLRRAP